MTELSHHTNGQVSDFLVADSSALKENLAMNHKEMASSRVNQTDASVAVIHVFRFEKDKVVELWDLGQLIDPNSPNKNGMF